MLFLPAFLHLSKTQRIPVGMHPEMQLIVNGKETEIERTMTIAEFLEAKGLAESMVAVEHNGNWLRREDWPGITLNDADRLEIVRIMAGG